MDRNLKNYDPQVSGWVFWPAMIGVVGIIGTLAI